MKLLRSDSHFRWLLLALIFAAAFLNYFDRQTVSVLKTTLKEVFTMKDTDYALLVNIFTGCYAAAYIASGWLVDKIGPKKALTVFAGLWSLVTIGCGLARNFWELAIMRGLLGLAEPGLQPVSIRVASAWAPPGRKGLFMSLCGIGSSIGNVIAPPVIVWLLIHYGWRSAFILPGVIGLAVAIVWWWLYRDPKEIAEAQPATPAAPPPAAWRWGQLWRTKALWGIVLARLVSDPVWYFCLFWLPGYLQEEKGLTVAQLGLVGWLPFIAANIGGLTASVISDSMAKKTADPLQGRKRLLFYASIAGPICLFIPGATQLSVTLVMFCLMAIVCACWLSTLAPIIAEIFPLGNVASVWGIAGAFGATGAMVFNYLLGHAATIIGLEKLFYIMGVLHPCAALLLFWLVRRPRVAPEPVAAAA